MLLPVTLKIGLRSRRMAPFRQVPLDARRFLDEMVALGYRREFDESVGDSVGPERLWLCSRPKFRRRRGAVCVVHLGSSRVFLTIETLNN